MTATFDPLQPRFLRAHDRWRCVDWGVGRAGDWGGGGDRDDSREPLFRSTNCTAHLFSRQTPRCLANERIDGYGVRRGQRGDERKRVV